MSVKLKTSLSDISIARLREHLRSPLYFNGYALTVSSAATSLIGILYWALAARFYTAEAVGKNSAAIAVILFLSGISGLNLDNTLVRFIPRAGRKAGRLIARAYLISLLVGIVVAPIFLTGLNLWSPALSFLNSNLAFSLMFMLAVLSGIIFVQEDGALTGMRLAKWVVVENTTYASLKLILLIIFARLIPQYGILLSWVAPVVVIIPIVNGFIFKKFIPAHIEATREIGEETQAPYVKYTASNYLGFLFYNAYAMLPPLLVIQFLGSKANAYFYLPWVIFSSLRLYTINMSTSMTVEGSLFQAKSFDYFRHVLLNALKLLTPVVLGLVLVAPLLLRVFGPEYAVQGTTLLRLLALSVIPNSLVSLYLGVSRLKYRFREIMLIQGTFAILSLSLTYILLPKVGIAGVGIAWIVSQTLIALAIFIYIISPSFQGWNIPAHQEKGKELTEE